MLPLTRRRGRLTCLIHGNGSGIARKWTEALRGEPTGTRLRGQCVTTKPAQIHQYRRSGPTTALFPLNARPFPIQSPTNTINPKPLYNPQFHHSYPQGRHLAPKRGKIPEWNIMQMGRAAGPGRAGGATRCSGRTYAVQHRTASAAASPMHIA